MKSNPTYHLHFNIQNLEMVSPFKKPISIQIEAFNTTKSLKTLSDPQLNHSISETFSYKVKFPLHDSKISIYVSSCELYAARVASAEIELDLIQFPFDDWISLQSYGQHAQPFAKILLKMYIEAPLKNGIHTNGKSLPNHDSNSVDLNTTEEDILVPKESKRDLMPLLNKGLQPLIGSIISNLYSNAIAPNIKVSPNETPAFKVEDYRSKLYIFGDDGTPRIIEFDFETENFRELDVPYNLHLFGYSMALGLPNGKIIITGGINKYLNTIVPTAFWYDPVTNSAKILANMEQPRYTHSMAYSNGEVFVMGGRYYGKDIQGVLHHCEKFDMTTKQWVKIADLNDKRCTASAVAYKNHIYIFGGYHGNGRLKSIEKYYHGLNKWEVLSLQMPVAIEAGFCQYIGGGKIVYIAGKDDVKHNSDVIVYNVDTMQSECVTKLTSGRVLPKYAFHKDKLYVFGGKSCNWERTSTIEWKFEFGGDYSHVTNSELKLFSCATSSNYLDLDCPANHGTNLYIFGNPSFPYILQYSIANQAWSQKSPPTNMKLYFEAMSAALPNGYILVFGGRKKDLSKCSKTVYLYDPKKNTILFASQLNHARYGATVLHKDGFVYVVGGKGDNDITIALCERYNLRGNRWEELESLVEPKARATIQDFNTDLYVLNGCQENKLLNSIERYSIRNNTWKILPWTTPFFSPRTFSYRLNTEEILLFNDNLENQVLFNPKTGQLKSSNTLPKTSAFMHCVHNQSSLYVFGESQLVQSLKLDADQATTQWDNLSKYPATVSKEILRCCSIARTLQVEDTQPLEFFDELALSDTVEKDASMFMFIKEQNTSKIIEYNLRHEQFHEIEIPEGMAIYKYASAVGLPTGRIIITGGLDTQGDQTYVNNITTYYAPLSNTLETLNPMHKCRYQHGAVLYQGNVYVIGGKEFYSGSKCYLKACERLDVKTFEWEEIPPLNIERCNFSVCCFNKQIYVLGGYNQNGLLKEIECYKEGSDWQLLGSFSLPFGLEGAVAISISYNQIFLIGGMTIERSRNEILCLRPLTELVDPESRIMLHHRHNCKAIMHGNSLFAIGGSVSISSEKSTSSGTSWKSFSSYENIIKADLKSAAFAMSKIDMSLAEPNKQPGLPEFNYLYILGTELNQKILRLSLPDLKWELIQIPEGFKLWDYSVAITLPNGKIFITGGINYTLTDIRDSASILDFSQPNDQACEVLPNMFQGRYTHTSCYMNNYVYVMGGRYYGNGQAGVLSKCERFHIPSRKWENIASLKCKRCTGVATTYMNRVYILGGYRGDGRVKTIERYNEVWDVWEAVPLILLYPIEAEGMVRISDREIVLLGGKDDFAEQAYVSVYDLERRTANLEKTMLSKRILCKTAKYKDEIFIIGGNSIMTCEKATIGEWNWTNFESYSSLVPNNLAKSSAAQGR